MESLTEFNKFNYIGSKYRLINNIFDNIKEKTGYNTFENIKIGDLFSGTSIVSYAFRINNANVISNDMEYYAYVIARAFTCSLYTINIQNKINQLNNLDYNIKGLIYNNYAPTKGNRMYFTDENAIIIDTMRISIEKWKNNNDITLDEYYYILTCILLASDKVANITSVYGAYLKVFKKSALKKLEVKLIHKNIINNNNKVYNEDINNMVKKESFDIVYLDPPYNERQYSKNYHILNYICTYTDEDIKGITGLLQNSNISMYCRKNAVSKQFENLLQNINTKFLFMSYNDESLMSKECILDIMKKYGKESVTEIDYKRFKSNSNGHQKKTIKEYIFCLDFR